MKQKIINIIFGITLVANIGLTAFNSYSLTNTKEQSKIVSIEKQQKTFGDKTEELMLQIQALQNQLDSVQSMQPSEDADNTELLDAFNQEAKGLSSEIEALQSRLKELEQKTNVLYNELWTNPQPE